MTNRSSALRTTLLTFPRLRESAYRRSLYVLSVIMYTLYVYNGLDTQNHKNTRIVLACFEMLKSLKNCNTRIKLTCAFLGHAAMVKYKGEANVDATSHSSRSCRSPRELLDELENCSRLRLQNENCHKSLWITLSISTSRCIVMYGEAPKILQPDLHLGTYADHSKSELFRYYSR
ncbi:uncharacterized protein V1478_010997 [Vespula squamosa]|uniref:Uncharacterized protein n=1 Tax=Vespula squamosa TaxID=30214 RepID=A0ABD2AG72_VESSQ